MSYAFERLAQSKSRAIIIGYIGIKKPPREAVLHSSYKLQAVGGFEFAATTVQYRLGVAVRLLGAFNY